MPRPWSGGEGERGMLCGNTNQADVVGLANCLLASWDFNYTVYYYLHYLLGAAGVLMPILSTILSDVENRNVRRAITGLSAASVSIYAFLTPMDKATTYKSAHTELRQTLVMYDQFKKNPSLMMDDFVNTMTLMGAIEAIEGKILNSEKSTAEDRKKKPTPPAAEAPAPEKP
jgi:hypothetical protein